MNPYQAQPPRAFWRTAVAERHPLHIDGLWTPKFAIDQADPIASLGSCFAQHISRALVAHGYNWINAEPAPPKFGPVEKARYQYELFSARTGNIYTAALLRQWMQWALADAPVPGEIWHERERFFDPFRPAIEPDGFATVDELLALRRQTLDALRRMFAQCRVFIFTLGLTEAWINRAHGYVYPLCPGTTAGRYDAEIHTFKNYGVFEIHDDLIAMIELLHRANADAQVLLTVSPVPLTATATADHVLCATTRSKSILRAAAASVVDRFAHVDYFPSYEIISSFPYRAAFFEPNLRAVAPEGVAHVMNAFMQGIGGAAADRANPTHWQNAPGAAAGGVGAPIDAVCEEMMLDAYGQ